MKVELREVKLSLVALIRVIQDSFPEHPEIALMILSTMDTIENKAVKDGS